MTIRLRPDVPVVPLSPRHALVGGLSLRDLPPGGVAALGLLDGRRSPARIAADTGVDAAWLDEVLRLLGERRLLAVEPTGHVVVLGEGAQAGLVVSLLLDEGLAVSRDEPVAGWGDVDCVVLAPATSAADRVTTDALVRADVCHLAVLPEPGGAVVGPVVVPGASACTRCQDEALAERDPAWARRSHLGGRAMAEAGPAARAWAAGLAAQLVLGWVTTGQARTGVSWHLVDGEPAERTWRVHPRCGCRLADVAPLALAS